jgi:dihydroflavonol-4-reductase
MRALVTGANGFTASHLVRRLLELGWQVRGLVRSTSNLARLQDLPVDLVYGDLGQASCDGVLATAMQGVEAVFHVAAYVEYGIIDVGAMERANVVGTRQVMQAAQAAGVSQVVYCSTIGIFGDTQGRVVDETFVREQQGYSSVYDRTKYEAQVIVDQLAQQGLPVVSVLPSGILGPDDPHFGPVVNLFLSGKLKLWVGGDRITGVVHVDDLCEAMILAAQQGQVGQKYIISAGEMTTRDMFAQIGQAQGIKVPAEAPEWLVRGLALVLEGIGRLTGWQPPLSRERVHYVYDRCVRVDGSRARRDLGWNPRSPQVVVAEVGQAARSSH